MAELNDELTLLARAIVCGEAPSAQIESVYSNYAAEVAIEVYRNNYRGNLHDALAGAYPVVKQLVGDKFFRFMARNYIGSIPRAARTCTSSERRWPVLWRVSRLRRSWCICRMWRRWSGHITARISTWTKPNWMSPR